MIASARSAGVPLLLALPVANLRSPPALSVHPEGFDDEPGFDADLRAARVLLERGKALEALVPTAAAVARSAGHAEAWFQRGRALAATGAPEEARSAFRRAVDLDARTHRITTPLAAALIEVATETGTPWVDLRPDFQDDLGEAAAGRLFVDHLHPTTEGHALTARRLAVLAERALAPRGSSGSTP